MKKQTNHTFQLHHYALKTFERYQTLSRKEKKFFLDQVVLDFKGHRKAIIRLFNNLIRQHYRIAHPDIVDKTEVLVSHPKQKRGRKPTFCNDDTLIWWLQTLWINMNHPSEKLMHSMMRSWLDKCQDSSLTQNLKEKLLTLSPATIERLIRDYKKQNHKKIFSTTKRSKNNQLMIKIPCRPIGFQAPSAGYIEGDTVAHCGGSLSGSFAWSLNTVDHKTMWSEQIAFLNNNAENIVEALIKLRHRYPFLMKGYHTDGGNEFINELVFKYLQNPETYALQTHGRPYKKNDQARVEQRNWTTIRQLFGYERIAHQILVDKMNDIYANEWRLLNNFFTATRQQISKVRIGAKFKRTFDKPKTPYERVLEQKNISDFEKVKLKKVYDSLNPFELKKSLERKLKEFEKLSKELLQAADKTHKEAA